MRYETPVLAMAGLANDLVLGSNTDGDLDNPGQGSARKPSDIVSGLDD